LAVATGKSRRGLDKVLAETSTRELFLESRCADETRSKPHPQMLQEILQALKVEPQQALMIGDTEYDMEMARNAGVHPVGVSYGVHEPDRLNKFKPAHILDNIRHLPVWLDNQKSDKPIHDNQGII
jgi:phosphoglycolate phosphatase